MLTFLLGTGYTVGCGAVGALLARLNLLGMVPDLLELFKLGADLGGVMLRGGWLLVLPPFLMPPVGPLASFGHV